MELTVRTLSDPKVDLVHVQILNIWGKDTVEQLHQSHLSSMVEESLESTHDVQNLLARVRPPDHDERLGHTPIAAVLLQI